MGNSNQSSLRYISGKRPEIYWKEDMWESLEKPLKKLHIDEAKGLTIFRSFVLIDVKQTGEIMVQDCIQYFAVDISKAIERIFVTYVESETSSFHFIEYAITLWNFCTYTNRHIAR